MKKTLITGLVLVLSLAFASLSAAAVMTFTDRATWEAAAGSWEDVDLDSQVGDGVTLEQGDTIDLPFDETLSFSIDLEGRQVPGSWQTWSGGKTPRVLYTDGSSSVTGTFGGWESMGGFGLEIEPNLFQVFSVDLELSDGTTITQDVDGFGGAAFFGWVGPGIQSMEISMDGDFAFGEMVKTELPSPGSLVLLVTGLVGVLNARRRHQ